jgi:hypothetical protein
LIFVSALGAAPRGPEQLDGWLKRSNLIVVGSLHINIWRFPWLDGFHYGGRIDVREICRAESPSIPSSFNGQNHLAPVIRLVVGIKRVMTMVKTVSGF